MSRLSASVRGNASAGFTLIEVMIVMVILAVLVSVAMPSYQNSMRKSARTAVKGALMDVMSRQEQFFMNNKSYSNSLSGLGLPDPCYIDKKSDFVAGTDSARVYRLTLANATATAFDVLGTAQLDQSGDACGNYTLKSDGSRLVSGSMGSNLCW